MTRANVRSIGQQLGSFVSRYLFLFSTFPGTDEGASNGARYAIPVASNFEKFNDKLSPFLVADDFSSRRREAKKRLIMPARELDRVRSSDESSPITLI